MKNYKFFKNKERQNNVNELVTANSLLVPVGLPFSVYQALGNEQRSPWAMFYVDRPHFLFALKLKTKL